MKKLTYLEIRQKYLDHLKKYDHAIINSAPIIPEDDPTVLYVNAGMFPLVPYLLGEKHPNGTRLANSQRCLRTGDIDEVGNETHLTTFEMLGNWSLNDYFKEDAIKITVDFFIDELGFDINHIYASVFIGNDSAPKDTTSIEVWKKIFKERGIDAEVGKNKRIQEYDKKENWWELPAGGPCGPDSEIFYDTGKETCGNNCEVACTCGKYIELGNNVFMEYLKESDKYSDLGKHNVDFGGGLDRLAMVNQGVSSVWETDISKPILDKVISISTKDNIRSQRIITDHIKAATWVIADGVLPGRTEREYILRMIIRRAIRHGRMLGIEGLFTKQVGEIAIQQFTPIYERLNTDKEQILNILEDEEKKFINTLEKGLKKFEKLFSGMKNFTNSENETFTLYETYGFPIEITIEELKNRKIEFEEDRVIEIHNKALKQHQDKSREASKGLFKGGLADTSNESAKLHTTTHLLLSALHKVLGDHVFQKGSNITPERLRLDFPNHAKLTPEQVTEVETIINDWIKAELPITFEELPKEKALEMTPYAAFGDKYGDIVKVYKIGNDQEIASLEICGGPHVSNTKELGTFRIKKQKNVGAGVKRIKAVLE